MLKPFISMLFVLVFSGACFSPVPPTPLQNTHWSLVRLMGNYVSRSNNQPEPHLFFHINDKSLHGSDGCNQLHAEYTQNEKYFRFIKIGSSQIRCQEGMEQARTFLDIMTKTDRIEIKEEDLIFYHAGKAVARFEARKAP